VLVLGARGAGACGTSPSQKLDGWSGPPARDGREQKSSAAAGMLRMRRKERMAPARGSGAPAVRPQKRTGKSWPTRQQAELAPHQSWCTFAPPIAGPSSRAIGSLRTEPSLATVGIPNRKAGTNEHYEIVFLSIQIRWSKCPP